MHEFKGHSRLCAIGNNLISVGSCNPSILDRPISVSWPKDVFLSPRAVVFRSALLMALPIGNVKQAAFAHICIRFMFQRQLSLCSPKTEQERGKNTDMLLVSAVKKGQPRLSGPPLQWPWTCSHVTSRPRKRKPKGS